MSNRNSEIDLIEQYLEGSLNEEKKEAVEEKISTDESYARNVERYKLLMDGIKYSGRKKLMAKAKKWETELSDDFTKEGSYSIKKSFRWYYAAAVIALFVAAGFIIYFNIDNNYDQVVAAHYHPYNYVSKITRGDKIEKKFSEEIFEYYDRNEYNQTIQMINKLDDDQKTDQVNFILANAYQAIDNYDEAISLYKEIIVSDSVYVFGSKWYLALCYLSKNKTGKAESLLEELQASNTSYSLKAKNLLKELN